MSEFDESAFTEHPTPSLTDGLTHAVRNVPGLSPEHAMIAARSENPSATAQSLAGLNLLSGAVNSHAAHMALNQHLLSGGDYAPGAQGPMRPDQANYFVKTYKPAPYVAPGPQGAQGVTQPKTVFNGIIPTAGQGAQGQYGLNTAGQNTFMNAQQIENEQNRQRQLNTDSHWENAHKLMGQWSDTIGEAFGQIFGVLGGVGNVAGSALTGFSNQTPGAAWTQGYDQLHSFGSAGGSFLSNQLLGVGEYAVKAPGRINQLGTDLYDAPGGTLARVRHDIAADANSVLYAPDHFYRYMVQTVHDKGWSYALGEMAAMIAMAVGTGGEGTLNAVRQLGQAGKSFEELTTPLALRSTKLPLRDGVTIGEENASPLSKFSGLNDTTRGAYERYRSIVESKAVAGTRFAFKPITEPMRRLAVASSDPGVALGEAMAMNHPIGLDSERWKQTENQDLWINPYTGVAASLGQQTMLMMGIDPKSWEGSILSGGLDFYTKFIMPDPAGAGLQVFTDAKSLEGCKGLLGQLFGGTGIRSAEDYDRIYTQYGAFRRTVNLIARSSSADLIRLYKGKLSPEMLTRFGNARTVDEVLDVFKSEAAAVEFQTSNMATLGGYTRTKYAMKDYLLRDPTLTAAGAARKGILQERLFASTPYIAMRNVGASIAKTMTQRGFYLSDTAGGTQEILVDKIVDGSIQSAHVLADRLTRMGVSQDVVKVTLEHLLEASRLGETQRYMQLAVNAQIKAGPRFVQALLRDPAMGPESIVIQHIAEESMKGRLHVDAVGTKGKYVHDDRDSELVNFGGETVATAGEGVPHLQSVPLLDPVQIRRAMRVLVRLSKDPVLMDFGVAMMMANKADGYTLDLIKTYIRDYGISSKKIEKAITSIFETKVANKVAKGAWAGQNIGSQVTLFNGEAREIFLQMFRDHAVDALGNKVPLAEQINNFRGELQNLANNGLHPVSRGEAAVLSTWLDGHLTTGYKPDLSDIYLGNKERAPLTPAERETIESEKYGERKLDLIGDRKFLKWSDARNLRINANLTMDAMNHVVNDMFFKPATLSSPSWAWHVGISEGILNAFRYGPINMFEAHFAAQFAQKAKKYSLADGVDHNYVRNAVAALLQDVDKKELEKLFDSDILQIARKEALAGGYVQGGQYGRQQLENLHDEIMGSVKENGGVSLNLHGKSFPSAGYGVATGSKNNVVINARDMFEDEEKAKKILYNYVKQVSENMSLKDKDLVLGIWHDTSDLTDPVLMNEFEKTHFLETTSSTTLKTEGKDGKTFAELTGGGVDLKGLNQLKKDGKITSSEYDQIIGKARFGKIHLDVTERVGSLTDAMKLGAERDQISIFDFQNFKEYNTGGSGVGGFNAFGKRQVLRKNVPIHFDQQELLKDYAGRTQRLDREGFKQKVAVAYMRAQRAKAGVMLGVRESIVYGMAGEAKARRLIDDATDLVLLHPGGIHPALSASHTRYLGEISGHVDDMELSPSNSKTKVIDPSNPLAKEKTRRWKTGTFETYKRGNRGHLNAMQHYIGTALNTEQHKFIGTLFRDAIKDMGIKEFQRQITEAKNAAVGDIRNAPIVRDIEAKFEAHLRAQPEEWRNRFLRSKFVSRNGLEKYDIRDPLKDWARVSVSTNMNTWMSGERDITHMPILNQIAEGNVKDLQWFKDYAARKGMTTMPDNIIGPRIMDGGSGRFFAQNLADKSHEKLLGPMVDYLSRRPAYLLAYHNEMEAIRKTNGVFKTTIGEHKQGLLDRMKFLEDEVRASDPSGMFDASLKKLHAAQAEFDRLEIEGRAIANHTVPAAVRSAVYREQIAELNAHIADLDKEIIMLTKSYGKEAAKVMAGYRAALIEHGTQMNAFLDSMSRYNYALAEHERQRAIMMGSEGLAFPTAQQHIEDWQFHSPAMDTDKMYGYSLEYMPEDLQAYAIEKYEDRMDAILGDTLFSPNPITPDSIKWGLSRSGVPLTQEQRKVLESYVAYEYKPINDYLRLSQTERREAANKKVVSRLDYELPFTNKAATKALDEAIAKVELQRPMTVFRGTDHRKYAVGELVPEPGYMSTSMDFEAAHDFSQKTGRSAELIGGAGATILEIQLSPGQKLWPRHSEGEIILPRGTSLYVHKVTEARPSELYPELFEQEMTPYHDDVIQHVVATVVDSRTARALNGRYAAPEVKAKYKVAATKLEKARAEFATEQRKTFGYAGSTLNPSAAATPEWAQTELTKLVEQHRSHIDESEKISEKMWAPVIESLKVEDAFTQDLWRKTGLFSKVIGRHDLAEWIAPEQLLPYEEKGLGLTLADDDIIEIAVKQFLREGFATPFTLLHDPVTSRAMLSRVDAAVIKKLHELGVTAVPTKLANPTQALPTAPSLDSWLATPKKDTSGTMIGALLPQELGFESLGRVAKLDDNLRRRYLVLESKIKAGNKILFGGKTYNKYNTLAKLQVHVDNVGKLKTANEYTQNLLQENHKARADALAQAQNAANYLWTIPVDAARIDEYAAKYPAVQKHVDAYKANRKAVYGDDWQPASTGSWSGLQSTVNFNKNLVASQGAWHRLELQKLQHVYDNVSVSAEKAKINSYIQEHMELWGDPSLYGGLGSKHYYDSEGKLQQAAIPFHAVQDGMLHEAQAQVLAETRAARKMLGEVHNPADKTNFEYAMRYIAPFYFAQNQAWRRAARLLAEDPAAFEKYMKLTLAMTNYAQTTADKSGNPQVTVPSSQLLGRSLFGLDMGLGLDLSSMNTTTLFGMNGKDNGPTGMMQHILKPEMGPLMTIPAKLLTGSIDYVAGMAGGQNAEMKVNEFSDWLQGDIASRQPLMAQLVPNTLIRHLYQLAVDGHIGLGNSPDSAGDSVGNGYISTRLQVWKNLTDETLKQLGEEMEQNGFHGYSAKEIRDFKRKSPGFYTVLEQMKWAMKSHSDPRFLQDIANRANRDTAVMWSLTTLASFFGPTTVTSTSGLQQLGIQLNQELQADISKLGTADGYAKFAKEHPTDSMSQIFQTTSPYNVTYPSTAPTLQFIQNHGEFVLQHPTIAAFFVPRPNDAPYDEAAHAVEMDLNLRGRSSMAQMSKSALVAWGNNWYYNYITPFADATFGKDYTKDKATYLNSSKKMYSQYNPMWANYHDNERLTHADDAFREFNNFITKGYHYSYRPSGADSSFKPIDLPVAVQEMDQQTQDLFYYAAHMANVYKDYVSAYANSNDRSGMKQQWYDYCQAMIKINPGLRSIANSMFIHLPGEGVTNG